MLLILGTLPNNPRAYSRAESFILAQKGNRSSSVRETGEPNASEMHQKKVLENFWDRDFSGGRGGYIPSLDPLPGTFLAYNRG
jgi:hypothetical protein